MVNSTCTNKRLMVLHGKLIFITDMLSNLDVNFMIGSCHYKGNSGMMFENSGEFKMENSGMMFENSGEFKMENVSYFVCSPFLC